MLKEAYYFPHFSNARFDRKIKRLRKELGVEGYAIYFMSLEVLRDQVNFRYPMQDIDLLADEFETSEQKLRVVIEKYDLFSMDADGNFFSAKLVEYLQPYLKKKEQRRLAGLQSGIARKAAAVKKVAARKMVAATSEKSKHDAETETSSVGMQISEYLFSKILDRNPTHKKPNLQAWAKQGELMLSIDKRDVKDIYSVIDWCQADSFWRNNILSVKKLREKFDQLHLKMGEDERNTKFSVVTEKNIASFKNWRPNEENQYL